MDMTKGAENPNKQKHEKPHNKLLCVTVCQEKKEVGEWNNRQERKKQSKSNEEKQNKTLKNQKKQKTLSARHSRKFYKRVEKKHNKRVLKYESLDQVVVQKKKREAKEN